MCDPLIQGCHTIDGVHDEHQHVGHLDAEFDLLFDLFIEIVDVIDPDPAGIHDLKKSTLLFNDKRHSVAGHTRNVVDDRQTSTGEPIEDARFADIGSANDGDLGDGHGTVSEGHCEGVGRNPIL